MLTQDVLPTSPENRTGDLQAYKHRILANGPEAVRKETMHRKVRYRQPSTREEQPNMCAGHNRHSGRVQGQGSCQIRNRFQGHRRYRQRERVRLVRINQLTFGSLLDSDFCRAC